MRNNTITVQELHIPSRFTAPPVWQYIVALAFAAFFVASLNGSGLTTLALDDVANIPKQVVYIINQMFPPSLERLTMVGRAMLQTLEMALIGNLIGIPLSLLLAILCARNLSPHPLIFYIARLVVTFIRTTPSLVWAIFLIVAVGLGPRAGTVTLIFSTIGFCGRFFAEAMEEVDPGPQEALTALGAGKMSTVICAVLPSTMPSLINTVLFNLEHTTRSSAVLGIVGAGGIGIELMVSIKTFHYDEAITIIFLVFIGVMGIEQLCATVRRRVLQINH